MYLIALYVGDPALAASLEATLAHHAHVQVCESRDRVTAMLRRYRVSALLIETSDEHGHLAIPFIAALHQAYPAVAIVLVVTNMNDLHKVPEAVRAGVTALVHPSEPDPWSALRESVTRVAVIGDIDQVLIALAPHVNARAWFIVECSVRLARENPNVDRLSFVLGMNRRTLVRRLTQAGLPGPANLLAWARLLVASSLLERTPMTVEQVARELRFPSPLAFRRVLKRHTGVTPRALRSGGGLDRVIQLFVADTRYLQSMSASRAVTR